MSDTELLLAALAAYRAEYVNPNVTEAVKEITDEANQEWHDETWTHVASMIAALKAVADHYRKQLVETVERYDAVRREQLRMQREQIAQEIEDRADALDSDEDFTAGLTHGARLIRRDDQQSGPHIGTFAAEFWRRFKDARRERQGDE